MKLNKAFRIKRDLGWRKLEHILFFPPLFFSKTGKMLKELAPSYRLPATRLSGCKTGAPSQADVDRPDPQEILVSKEA